MADAAARQDLLDAIATAIDEIAFSVASLGEAYDHLDETTGDRLEERLFRPAQHAYGAAQRTHNEFAGRHDLPTATFAPRTRAARPRAAAGDRRRDRRGTARRRRALRAPGLLRAGRIRRRAAARRPVRGPPAAGRGHRQQPRVRPDAGPMSRTVVITGANSGIGLGAARRFAADGDHVVLAVRSTEKGERAAATIDGEHRGPRARPRRPRVGPRVRRRVGRAESTCWSTTPASWPCPRPGPRTASSSRSGRTTSATSR